MRSVILCEGQDDLWFLAYYLNKTQGWIPELNQTKPKLWGKAKIPCNLQKQQIIYMCHPQNNNILAVKSVAGEANLITSLQEVLERNQKLPTDPIHAVVLFRDCDDRDQGQLAQSMQAWFDDEIILHNNEVTDYLLSEEYDLILKVLPLVIPFDEQGAIETLLLKSIGDNGIDGAYVATHAKEYVEATQANVTSYLKKQREFTKAKYAAAMAIIDPTHSRDTFNQLMNATPWEESCTIHEHMERAVKLISGQLELAEV